MHARFFFKRFVCLMHLWNRTGPELYILLPLPPKCWPHGWLPSLYALMVKIKPILHLGDDCWYWWCALVPLEWWVLFLQTLGRIWRILDYWKLSEIVTPALPEIFITTDLGTWHTALIWQLALFLLLLRRLRHHLQSVSIYTPYWFFFNQGYMLILLPSYIIQDEEVWNSTVNKSKICNIVLHR